MKPGFLASALASTLTLATAALAGCGGSDAAFEPGAGDSAGTGTNTLRVDGSISADADVANASAPDQFTTDFRIEVSLNGAPVTTGTVTVRSASGAFDLTFDGASGDIGQWVGSAPGYDEVYGLDVAAGADEVTGVRVDGPDLHTFTAPMLGATVDATMTLPITWRRSETADTAVLDTDEIDDITIADTGSYDLAAGSLKTSQDQAEPNDLRLRRTNRVVPAGAVAGSEVTVSIRNEINVVAQPAP